MRMRGVEKNISLRDAKFTICQPEVCAVPGVVVVVGEEKERGRRGEAVGVRYVSLSIRALQHALFAAAAACPDNKSFPTAPSGNLVIPTNNIWRC